MRRPVIAVLICMLSALVNADNRVLPLSGQETVSLDAYLYVLKDASRSLTYGEVSTLSAADRFLPLSERRLTLDSADANYWVRLELKNSHVSEERTWFLHNRQQPGLRRIALFEKDPLGDVRQSVTGDTLSYASRDVDSLSFVFRLHFEGGEHKTIYLLFDDNKVPRSVPLVLHSEQAFERFDRFSWMVVSGYYSVVLALFVYNLLLWVKLRESAQLIYLGYILAFVVSMASIDGVAALLTQWGSIDLSRFSDEAYVMVMLTVQVAFVARSLELKMELPEFLVAYRVVMGGIASFAAAYFVLGRGPLTQTLFGVAMAGAWVFLLALISVAIRRRLTGAKNLLIAELCMMGGYLVATLAYYGAVPDNTLTSFMPAKIGNLLQLIFFSMVIGERARMAILKSAEDRHQLKLAQTLSQQDPLTGLHNRRSFFDLGHQMLDEARCSKKPLSVIMLDIDWFKSVNDRFGHKVGDEVIGQVADYCRTIARESDVVGRLGGEEFAVIVPSTAKEGAFQLAERLRETVARSPALPDGSALTVSVGVAACTEEEDGVEAALNRADQALYQAKAEGRNCVRCWSSPQVPLKGDARDQFSPAANGVE